MSKIHILSGEFSEHKPLQFAPGIKAGFPSPADDYRHDTLDFNRDFIRHPEATFYGRVDGDSMIEAGISLEDIHKELASRHVIDKKVKQEKMTS